MYRRVLFALVILISSPCTGALTTTLEGFYRALTQQNKDAAAEIRKSLARIHESHLTDPVWGEVVKFYEQRDFQPFWLIKGRWSLRAENALDVLKSADSHGLDATNYAHAHALFPTRKSKKDVRFKPVSDDALKEIYFCAHVFRYMIDLTGGRVLETILRPITEQKPGHISPSDIISRNHQKDETGAWIRDFFPKNAHYLLLREELGKLRTQWKAGKVWMPLTSTKDLSIGSKGKAVRDLTEVLIQRGFLDEEKPLDAFDHYVEASVRKFQEEHNLPITGKVTPATRTALNQPLDQRIRQVIVTMERTRWLPNTMPETYVWVNIPSFHLELYRDGTFREQFKTCVGKTNTPTPQMVTTMYGLRFNPSWTVPRRIALTLLPQIRNDPDYLQENNFTLLNMNDRSLVDLDDLDVVDLDLDAFPYVLRQPPGSENTLGQIRFSLRNKHSIHMHDTKHKKLFDKHTRTFSAGCVRVNNPERLAYLMLNQPDRWAPSVIAKFLATDELKDINLETEPPVYIVYHTVWFTHDGRPRYAKDIYKNDQKLDFALHAYESLSHEIDIKTLATHKDAANHVDSPKITEMDA